jgi:hypothetical protein
MADANAFDFFDFSEEESEQTAKDILSEGYDRDGRICMCGHPMKRHNEYSGIMSCSPTRLVCPCKKSRPVIDVSDTRVFLRKTRGPGSLHALAQGILAAGKAGHKVEWLIEHKCDKCGVDAKVSPVAVTQHGAIVDEATGYDALLCVQCREGLGSSGE